MRTVVIASPTDGEKLPEAGEVLRFARTILELSVRHLLALLGRTRVTIGRLILSRVKCLPRVQQ